ncbi:MAG TPA: tetratricopeptide repeat protein [Opitutaceae bacterium]|nr:tetratricopeptide repeat protein [Opitutaceae bacterium]
MVHTFPTFEIDEDKREFRARGCVVKLQPKVFDLLAFLATHRDRVVSKEELLDSLWAGVIVADGSLQRAVSLARSALADAGASDAIRTFSRQGYRLVVEGGAQETEAAGVSRGAAAAPEPDSIAVLAFVDMSPRRDREYFSDGIAEELLNLLAKIPQLRVIARTSSFSFKGKDVPISEIARRLHVAHVLEGSVRWSGSKVRVTAQLIRASDSSHVWSETHDRPLDDIFHVQDEIAGAVVEQLKIRLLGAPPRAVETDSGAFALFLQARQEQRRHSAAGYENALRLLTRVFAIDPDYAPAWDLRGSILVNQAGKSLIPATEGYRKSREATERALAINPEYAPAHGALGWIAMYSARDFAAAARHYERALALAPSDVHLLVEAAGLMVLLGRDERAIAIREFAVSRDPANAFSHTGLGRAYRSAGRHVEALACYRRALALSPGMVGIPSRIGAALLSLNQPKAALAEAEKEPIDVLRLIAVATIRHALGHKAKSDEALREVMTRFGADWACNIARVLAFRGEADRAFEWLEKAVEANDSGLAGIGTEREFDNLRGDKRWLPFLRKIGMSPRHLAAIRFEVDLPK